MSRFPGANRTFTQHEADTNCASRSTRVAAAGVQPRTIQCDSKISTRVWISSRGNSDA